MARAKAWSPPPVSPPRSITEGLPDAATGSMTPRPIATRQANLFIIRFIRSSSPFRPPTYNTDLRADLAHDRVHAVIHRSWTLENGIRVESRHVCRIPTLRLDSTLVTQSSVHVKNRRQEAARLSGGTTRMRSCFASLALVLVAVLFGVPALAQDVTSGAIAGKVADPTGR